MNLYTSNHSMLQNRCITPDGLNSVIFIDFGWKLEAIQGILSWISLNFISCLMSFCEPMHSIMSGVAGTVVVATGVFGLLELSEVVVAVVATGVTGTARGGGTAIVGISGTSGTA